MFLNFISPMCRVVMIFLIFAPPNGFQNFHIFLIFARPNGQNSNKKFRNTTHFIYLALCNKMNNDERLYGRK